VPTHAGLDAPPTREHHDVLIEAGSRLAGIYGERRPVNSLHHQAVDRLGSDLRVTARADDGGIEGIEHIELPIVAVQWHPEMMTTASTDPIFAWLVDQAREHRLAAAR
jgi:putative glutamine amidotransferase